MLCILSNNVVKAIIMLNGDDLMRQKAQPTHGRNIFEKQQWGKPQLVIYLSLTMGKYIKANLSTIWRFEINKMLQTFVQDRNL